MNLLEATDSLNRYKPEILILGVSPPEDGVCLLSSVLVQSKEDYRQQIKQFIAYRVFKLKEGDVTEVNKKLLP